MSLNNMKVFNDFAYSAMTETIAQEVQKFNAASRGAIVLQNKANVGDFAHEASFALIPSLVRTRNAYGSGTVTPVDISQLQNTSVKVASGTPPVRFEPQQFDWIQRSPDEAGTVYGTQLAVGMVGQRLNLAIAALVGATLNNTAVSYTGGNSATAKLNTLNRGAALFGDRAGQIVAWVMHSKVLHDLYDAALTNSSQLFVYDNVQVRQDGFGRILIVTDSPALFAAGAGGSGADNYYTLGLTAGSALVEDNGDLRTYQTNVLGNENVQQMLQSEWTSNLGLKGYTWNTASGGKSPQDAAIGTGANWTKTATSDKDTAGVVVTTL